ncbi:MAG: hypothetical protein WC489_02845 [Patescibacteria group bacterium]
MKKGKKNILFLAMTIGILATVVYLSILLSNRSETAVTQIKKTKASSQTYHRSVDLLALNTTPSDPNPTGNETVEEDIRQPTQMTSPTKAQVLPVDSSVTPSPDISTQRATTVPTPTSVLLVYRTLTVAPTLIPAAETGGEAGNSEIQASATPTKSIKILPTSTQKPNKTLPETGLMQFTTILFIVGATTVFFAFLF